MNDETEKYFKVRFNICLDDLSVFWREIPDAKRLKLIKSIIWTAPDSQNFLEKVKQTLNSEKFMEQMD